MVLSISEQVRGHDGEDNVLCSAVIRKAWRRHVRLLRNGL